MSIQITPNAHRVVVSPLLDTVERSFGSLVIPSTAEEKPTQGVVRAIGKDVKAINVNDVVLYTKHSGVPYTIDSKPILILLDSEVLVNLGPYAQSEE